MQPIRRVAFAVVPAIAAAVLPVGAAGAGTTERTPSYEVVAELDAKGRLSVIETIVHDFGTARRHGITRTIPTRPAALGGAFVDNVSVRGLDGPPVGRTVQRREYRTTIRIGDPKHAVTGRHTYELRYTLGGVTLRRGTDVRIAWDALGTGWRAPIGRATVRLAAPERPSGVRCYTGPEGAHGRRVAERTTGRALVVAVAPLARGSGITVEAGFPAGKVAADPLTADRARVTAEERHASPRPVAEEGPSGGEKLTWGLVIGGVLAGVVALGLAARGGRGGGSGTPQRGDGYGTGGAPGGGGPGGGGTGGGAGGGGGGSW